MIQYWMKTQLAARFPNVRITVDYEATDKQFITIFYEGGSAPGENDMPTRKPRYMVWIQSDDFGYAEYMAQEVFKLFHQMHRRRTTKEIDVEYYKNNIKIASETILLHKLVAESDPNRIGAEDGAMQYTVNFTAVTTP